MTTATLPFAADAPAAAHAPAPSLARAAIGFSLSMLATLLFGFGLCAL